MLVSTPVCSLKGDLATASTEHRVAEQEWLTKLQTAEATCQSCKPAAVMPDMQLASRRVSSTCLLPSALDPLPPAIAWLVCWKKELVATDSQILLCIEGVIADLPICMRPCRPGCKG